MATTLPPPSPRTEAVTRPPRLARGVELIGRFEGSGFKEPPFIARRADGQVVQMAPMLYALAEEIDGTRGYEAVADRLSHRIERGVTGEMAEHLVEAKLRPLGIVAPADGAAPELRKIDPLLALKFRTKVIPERVVARITSVFQHLFHVPVVALALTAFAALDVWLFGIHGVSQSVRYTLYDPVLLLGLLGCVVIATAFHEIGHASACRFGGARPGVMGIGVYIVWPAFYTDITDSYRLDKRGRLRTDLGGMYFNALFALAAGVAYFATGLEPLLLLVALQNAAIVQQALPFLRLDGYYILSDLTGVPDILLRIRAILTSLLPWRDADRRVTELRSWVRAAVTSYVVALVPTLAFVFAMMLINAPRVFATGWDSFWVHWDRVGPELSHGAATQGALSIVQMLVLLLPAAGIAYTSSRVAHRAGMAGWRWSAGRPVRRACVVAGAVTSIAGVAFLWWPHGDYRPIQPGERGTIVGGLRQIADIPTGRAALTPQRAVELNGAPSLRDGQAVPQRRGTPGTTLPRPTTRGPRRVNYGRTGARHGSRPGDSWLSPTLQELWAPPQEQQQSPPPAGSAAPAAPVAPEQQTTTSPQQQPAPSGSTTSQPQDSGTTATPTQTQPSSPPQQQPPPSSGDGSTTTTTPTTTSTP